MDITDIVDVYKNRFQVKEAFISSHPSVDLSLIIAIPSYKEKEIKKTLESLKNCIPPRGDVEVLITINAPDDASAEDLAINDQTVEDIKSIEASLPDFLKVHIIRQEQLPKKHAGAGLARKIGMDEAVQRWASINKDGAIVCLDADCEVSSNYLIKAEEAFARDETKVVHFNFEHPYEEERNEILAKGIVNYELHLRYYIQGLKYAGFKLAVHTVGSSMGCRASTYARTGGMNKRRAGEDFYFLHKLVPHGGWKDIMDATVFPSCRVSDRVPFGTGRAQMEWVEDQSGKTYDSELYDMMRPLFTSFKEWYKKSVECDDFHAVLIQFLEAQKIKDKVAEMNKQSTSEEVFEKRFWQWMDGFMVMKMTHYLRDNGYPNKSVLEASNELLSKLALEKQIDKEKALSIYRKLDREVI